MGCVLAEDIRHMQSRVNIFTANQQVPSLRDIEPCDVCMASWICTGAARHDASVSCEPNGSNRSAGSRSRTKTTLDRIGGVKPSCLTSSGLFEKFVRVFSSSRGEACPRSNRHGLGSSFCFWRFVAICQAAAAHCSAPRCFVTL